MSNVNDNNFDFKYASFQLSRDVLESYIQSAIYHKKSLEDSKFSYNHSAGVVDCIISCIASNDFNFNKNDKRMFKTLYKMLRDYAHDNGKYTEEARTAMRVLCSYCGFASDTIVLIDRKPMGRMARFKQRFNKWFGFDEEHDDQEDKIDQMFDAVAQQTSRVKHDVLLAEAEKRHLEAQRIHEENKKKRVAEMQRIREEATRRTQAKQTPQEEVKKHTKTVSVKKNDNSRKTKRGLFATIGVTITGFVALGAAMLLGTHNSTSTVDNSEEPVFKNIDIGQSAHYNNVTTYNMIDSLKKQKSNLDSVMQYRAPAVKIFVQKNKQSNVAKSEHCAVKKQTVQTTKDLKKAVAITQASRSALNILIGTEKAQKLCDKIQAKVDAGIFKLPKGLSVERVAHAMEMSRIYEGHSVILDALNSDAKLTVEQQHAFDNHIASIGDLGIKLQKRMASQHNLSKYSRYDNAKKSLRMAHVKNLKQLKQMKKHMR